MKEIQFGELAQIFGWENRLVNIVVCLVFATFFTLVTKKAFQILQLSGYGNKKFRGWLFHSKDKFYVRMILLSMLNALAYLVIAGALTFIGKYIVSYAALLAILALAVFFIVQEEKLEKKVTVKFTPRMRRLILVHFLLTFIVIYFLMPVMNFIAFKANSPTYYMLCFAPLSLLPLILPFILMLANAIVSPFEKLNNAKYIKRCRNILAERKDLIKIGITGSYGKTSVKEILSVILSEKFSVLKTPKSYNTPLGISLAVNGLEDGHQVFIAEMGARNTGDIAQLCDIVKPDVGIITGITGQHLESFGSIDNIVRTKNELIENLSENGFAVFNLDGEYVRGMYENCSKDKYFTSLAGGYASADNIALSENGSVFELTIEGKGSVKCACRLIGRHNISNILAAAAVAARLGLSLGEIASGIAKIEKVPHRLELLESGGVKIIDDSYNSNPDGVRAAIATVSEFSGRKIIVTPGIVELGEKEEEENFRFGEEIASAFDVAVIVGSPVSEHIKNGLEKAGFSSENIYAANSLSEAKDVLVKIKAEGDVVLFENDLPDNYS